MREAGKQVLGSKSESEQSREGAGDMAGRTAGDSDGQSGTVEGEGGGGEERRLQRTVIERVGRETGRKEAARS